MIEPRPLLYTETYSYGASGGGVKATITAAPATAPAPLPMANVKELMMKLIQDNPSYLTSGIPNELLTQLIMTSNTTVAPTAPAPSPIRGAPRLTNASPAGSQYHPQRILMTPGDLMKVKQPVVYNVCFCFLLGYYPIVTTAQDRPKLIHCAPISAEPGGGRPGRRGNGSGRDVRRILARQM